MIFWHRKTRMENKLETAKRKADEHLTGVNWNRPKKQKKEPNAKNAPRKRKNEEEFEEYPENEKNIGKKRRWSPREEKEIEVQKTLQKLQIGPDHRLKEFDITEFKLDNICVCFGKRRTGKTWIVRYVLFLLQTNFYHGLVITNTKFNGFWQNYFPKQVVHGKYSDGLVRKFMAVQKKLKRYAEEHPEKKINYWAVIVLDDIVADKHIRYSETLHELFYNGRHYGIFVIITSQYFFGLPPGLRSNADHVFVLQQSQKRQREQAFDDYGLSIYDKDLFMKILDTNTEDRGVFCINLTDPTIAPEKIYSTWKVTDVPKFMIGDPEWIKKISES